MQLKGRRVRLDLCRTHTTAHVRVDRAADQLDDQATIEVLVQVDGFRGVILEVLGGGLALRDRVEEDSWVGNGRHGDEIAQGKGFRLSENHLDRTAIAIAFEQSSLYNTWWSSRISPRRLPRPCLSQVQTSAQQT